MAAALIMTLCRLEALLALVRLPCSEPLRRFSLTDIALHWNVLFSVSFGARFELLPIAINECELSLCHEASPQVHQRGRWHLSALSAPLQPAISSATLLPETPCSTASHFSGWIPAPRRRRKKNTTKLHHSNLTGKAGDLLTQSKLFIFRLVGGGSGYMNKKAALSLSKHGACVARVITMTEQFSTQRTEWESTANALCMQHRGIGISLEMLWLWSWTQTRAKHVATETCLLHNASTRGVGAFQERNQTTTALCSRNPEQTQVLSLAKHTFMEPLAVWSNKLTLLVNTYTICSCSPLQQ